MHRLTRLFTLMVIAKLAAATAIEQIPVVVDLAASKSLRENNLPFPAHELSPTNPTFQAEHHENLSNPAQTDNSLARPIDPWLITSPYTEQSHLTNLSTLPLPSRLLTLALTHLKPTTSSYATTPYRDALNWPTVFENLKSISASHNHTWTSTTFYVVEFRSQLKANIDRELLFHLDKESHREATESGGLLKYWYGSTGDDVDGKNLATCLWVKKEDAVAGGRGPMHRQARGAIPKMYESINVKGLKLTVGDDVSSWEFEPWVETP